MNKTKYSVPTRILVYIIMMMLISCLILIALTSTLSCVFKIKQFNYYEVFFGINVIVSMAYTLFSQTETSKEIKRELYSIRTALNNQNNAQLNSEIVKHKIHLVKNKNDYTPEQIDEIKELINQLETEKCSNIDATDSTFRDQDVDKSNSDSDSDSQLKLVLKKCDKKLTLNLIDKN